MRCNVAAHCSVERCHSSVCYIVARYSLVRYIVVRYSLVRCIAERCIVVRCSEGWNILAKPMAAAVRKYASRPGQTHR